MKKEELASSASRKFKLSCRMLRNSGLMDEPMPFQRKGESRIDWMVRIKLAPHPHVAAEMLLLSAGLTAARDELLQLPELDF